MNKICRGAACLTLVLVLAHSVAAFAQSRLPPGAMPSIPPLTPHFNKPGPQIVPVLPQFSAPPTDPPSGPLGIR
jgi:hypothetical protein